MIADLGAIPGRWAGPDPTGRYLTTVDGDAVTTYDVAGHLVASHATGRPRLVATHPDGTAVAVLTAGWSIEVWRVAGRETGLGGSPAVTKPLGGSPAVTAPLAASTEPCGSGRMSGGSGR